jgi:hypothetical protein
MRFKFEDKRPMYDVSTSYAVTNEHLATLRELATKAKPKRAGIRAKKIRRSHERH